MNRKTYSLVTTIKEQVQNILDDHGQQVVADYLIDDADKFADWFNTRDFIGYAGKEKNTLKFYSTLLDIIDNDPLITDILIQKDGPVVK